MSDTRELLRRTAELAADYVESLGERPVFPEVDAGGAARGARRAAARRAADRRAGGRGAGAAAEPGVVAMGSGRYFGFVIGGALPAALAADWLASAWDQNAGLYVGGPSASVVEQVDARVARRPARPAGRTSSIGFVTGTQMAHVTGLAAARWHVLDAAAGTWRRRADRSAARARARRREAARDGRPRAAPARARRARAWSRPTTQGRLVPDALREGSRLGAARRSSAPRPAR